MASTSLAAVREEAMAVPDGFPCVVWRGDGKNKWLINALNLLMFVN